jgi:hypothetical protein
MEIMGKTDLLDIPLLLVMINFLFVSLKNHNKILKCSSILFSVGQHIPNAIRRWISRTNKLVDGCYSF